MPRNGVQFGVFFLVAVSWLAGGCSPKRIAIEGVADMLSSGTDSLASDDDPDFVGDALPFALMALEGVAETAPEHVGVRETLAAGFVQYAYGWADLEAQLVKYEDYDRYLAYKDLARKRYLRGKRWGMEGLEIRSPGLSGRLEQDPAAACEALGDDSLPLLYWTGTGWLAAISSSLDRPRLLVELPQAIALLERAYALDPDHDRGGLHEIMMALDMSRGPGAGGGEGEARLHYESALSLSEGRRASVFVGYATSIAVKTRDRAGFLEALERALDIDLDAAPEYRLSNLLSQKRARYLMNHVDDLFEFVEE